MILTQQEAAKMLQVSPASLQRMVKNYDLPVLMCGRKTWFDKDDLIHAMKQHLDQPKPE